MSDINEKMIGEFLELLKKVGSVEMQVQSMTGEYATLIKRATDMTQNMQDTLDHRLKNQNDVVANSLNKMANDINHTISNINSRINAIAVQPNSHDKQDAKINALSDKIEKISKFLCSFGKDRILEGKVIEDLPLTVRTMRCLQAEDIKTVEQLLKIPQSELFKIPNFGRKSFVELRNCIKNLGFELHE